MALTKAQKAAKAATEAASAAALAERQRLMDGASPDASAQSSVPKAGNTGKLLRSEGSMGPKIKLPAIHDNKPAGSGRTVVVVCKQARGLYLQHHNKISQDQRVMGGGIEKREVSMPVGEQVRLKPSILAFGLIPNYTIVNGFSFNHVDANFWNEWYAQNPKFGLLEAGLLCAFDNEQDARAYCTEYGSLKHGLEPLLQSKDPRIEQPTSKNLTEMDIDTDVPGSR